MHVHCELVLVFTYISMNIVMNVCRPHSGSKEQDFMSQEVHRAVKQRPCIWHCLHGKMSSIQPQDQLQSQLRLKGSGDTSQDRDTYLQDTIKWMESKASKW
jgi:hypothetical protein